MSFEESNSVIYKKARHAREDFDARAMSPAKALRLAIEKCGDRLFRLALTVCAVEQRGLTHGALKAECSDDCLILLLDGPGGARGSILLDRHFTQALVEVQTMGSVRPGEAVARPFTGTDAARAMALRGAEILVYPTAIGSEPNAPEEDTRGPWQRVMLGHAVANAMPVAAANRIGAEDDLTFYGSSFICDHRGEVRAELGCDEEGVAMATFDRETLRRYRANWGFFRDRRPELYGRLTNDEPID